MTKELANGIALEVGAAMMAILVGISIWALVAKKGSDDMDYLWLTIIGFGTVILLAIVPIGVYNILMGH